MACSLDIFQMAKPLNAAFFNIAGVLELNKGALEELLRHDPVSAAIRQSTFFPDRH